MLPVVFSFVVGVVVFCFCIAFVLFSIVLFYLFISFVWFMFCCCVVCVLLFFVRSFFLSFFLFCFPSDLSLLVAGTLFNYIQISVRESSGGLRAYELRAFGKSRRAACGLMSSMLYWEGACMDMHTNRLVRVCIYTYIYIYRPKLLVYPRCGAPTSIPIRRCYGTTNKSR